MNDTYEVIELEFYRDLKESEQQLKEEKEAVEEIMKANSVEYALEIVGNVKKNYYDEEFTKGYTLNLIIKKIDLHYVLKLLDENNIGFFASEEEKRNAVLENDIDYDEYNEDVQQQVETEYIQNEYTKAEYTQEEYEIMHEQGNTIVKLVFAIIFLGMNYGEFLLSRWLLEYSLYNYLNPLIICIIVQNILFICFLGSFKNKVDHL